MAVRQRISPEEYLALPEDKPYLEYINGEVVPKVAPDIRHMRLARELILEIGLYCRVHGGDVGPEGRVEFYPPGDTRFLLPDVAYWAPDRPIEGSRAMLPPTIAAEVRSPGQSLPQLRERAAFFLANGVEECWIAVPESRTVEIFTKDGLRTLTDTDTLETPLLPGFSLSLATFFSALDQ